jgi:hypothetical protein
MNVKTDLGPRLDACHRAQEVLTNEKYIGNNVYNRISFKLKKTRVAKSQGDVDQEGRRVRAHRQPDLFYTAQGIIRERNLTATPTRS